MNAHYMETPFDCNCDCDMLNEWQKTERRRPTDVTCFAESVLSPKHVDMITRTGQEPPAE